MTNTYENRPKTSIKPTVIAFHSEKAQSAFLAGTFNGWDTKVTPLAKDNKGDWSVSLPLPPGSYEYKFIIDGEWRCEPGFTQENVCPQCVRNEFGTMNRVLEVK